MKSKCVRAGPGIVKHRAAPRCEQIFFYSFAHAGAKLGAESDCIVQWYTTLILLISISLVHGVAVLDKGKIAPLLCRFLALSGIILSLGVFVLLGIAWFIRDRARPSRFCLCSFPLKNPRSY